MSQKLIVTNLTYHEKEYTVCALYEASRLLEVQAQPKEADSLLGNIYVGRVKDVVKNLNAAFIEIAPGVPCYFPLKELNNPIYVKKINSPHLVQGDELLVQVEKESIKTKPPRVTTNLNLTGKYLVLTTGNQNLGLSKKLDKAARARLKAFMEAHRDPRFGMVLRTNSQNATEEQLLAELCRLQEQAGSILDKAAYQTCFACLLKQKPEFLKALQNAYVEQLEEIVTDDAALLHAMQEFLEEYQPEDVKKLRFYEDSMISLSKCCSLEVKLKEALGQRVWLKSGAYLIIQPTEALTVIDVNSGKSMAKSGVQEHYLKVNLEAAAEIAAQLRLRNISGIIVVDFIDMDSQEAKEQLLMELRRVTRPDPIPVQVVDMTKLNLVELTRKKVRRSLSEQFLQP